VYLQGTVALTASSATPVVIDQRDKVFVPAVTVIQTGTEVNFPNSDAVSHHVYSFAQPNAFELPLYKGTRRPQVRFEKAGVVTLGCNIHDNMIGWIVVVDTPYFVKADAQGTAKLDQVAEGQYELFVWSPRLNPALPISIGPISVNSGINTEVVTVAKKLRAAPTGGALVAGDY
jgi:plastocyanin